MQPLLLPFHHRTANPRAIHSAVQPQHLVQCSHKGSFTKMVKKWTYYTGAGFADGTTNHGGYDANGYIIVAAPSNVPFGTHVQTPLGEGVVHDRGTAIVGNHYDLVMP